MVNKSQMTLVRAAWEGSVEVYVLSYVLKTRMT